MVLTYGGITDVRIPVDMMTDEEDTPGELKGGGSVATEVVVTVTTVVCTDEVPYAETVDVSVTGTVVVTVVIEPDAGADTETVDGAAGVADTVSTVVTVDVPNRPTDVEVTVTREDPVYQCDCN